jgi:N-acetylglucosamine kinase-like BadF-type ATPase
MGYFIGVDGGATKTAAVLADEQGNIINRALAPASNYVAVGRDFAGQSLHKAITDVVDGADKSLADCTMAVFGLAGCNNDTDHGIYSELINAIGLGGDVAIENDVVIAWAAATACQPGAVVIAGTGGSAFGMNAAGERAKTLGWDYILADQGSGYWIGLHGLQAAVKYWDGRLTDSGHHLYDAMLDQYGVDDPAEAMLIIYSDEHLEDMKTEIASFARLVSDCAAKGDMAAQVILRQAGEELGQSVCAVIRRLNMQQESLIVGRVGSTFKSGPILNDVFNQTVLAVAPRAKIEEARFRAQVGALIYGYNALGMLNDDLLERLPTRDEMSE